MSERVIHDETRVFDVMPGGSIRIQMTDKDFVWNEKETLYTDGPHTKTRVEIRVVTFY